MTGEETFFWEGWDQTEEDGSIMIRVGDRFNVEVATKAGSVNEIWTVEKMDDKERVTVKVEAFVKGKLTERKTRKHEELITLMVWAHNHGRLSRGKGEPLRRLVP